ncbi:hypothetical protein ACFXPY_27660 [Streptomyces sp. NPDC059153]|uniref:hypothetical protein n=1 Tax=Streptomyces sp. NPDC059153 TaxID=3346743 RepID=UPI0036741880
MSFTWYPDREYFTGGATVPCAYDPGWKTGDAGPAGDRRMPPALGPARRDQGAFARSRVPEVDLDVLVAVIDEWL